MSLQRSLDRAIARENRDPRGLPQDMLDAMEADVRGNPDKYPHLARYLAGEESMRACHPVRRMRRGDKRDGK